MLRRELMQRIDLLVAAHENAVFTTDEFATQIGYFLTAENLSEVLGRLPQKLVATVKDGIGRFYSEITDSEFLRPERSPFESVDIFDRYYRNVAEMLLESNSNKRRGILSVACLPSFEVEWAVRLLGSEKNGYSLALNVAETKIWNSSHTPQIVVKRADAAIPAEHASLVIHAWQSMLLRVRHCPTGSAGLDGVTYHFGCHGPGAGWMAGKTWSPDEISAPGKLVALSQLLYQYVEASEQLRGEMLSKIRDAALWFKGISNSSTQIDAKPTS